MVDRRRTAADCTLDDLGPVANGGDMLVEYDAQPELDRTRTGQLCESTL